MIKFRPKILIGLFSLAILLCPIVLAQPASLHPDWFKFPKIEQQFMQGCLGNQTLSSDQKVIKQGYCACAFHAYQTRYNPQFFSQINAYAVQFGKAGPTLVNLMMKPELDQCSAQTGYTRSP